MPLPDADPHNPISGTTHERYVDVREAARILGVSKSFLDKLRCSGGGPVYVQPFGTKLVRYPIASIHSWAQSALRRNTSDMGQSATPPSQRTA